MNISHFRIISWMMVFLLLFTMIPTERYYAEPEAKPSLHKFKTTIWVDCDETILGDSLLYGYSMVIPISIGYSTNLYIPEF